jgi:hypothetical protein
MQAAREVACLCASSSGTGFVVRSLVPNTSNMITIATMTRKTASRLPGRHVFSDVM